MAKKTSTLKPFAPKIDRRLLRASLKEKRKELRKVSSPEQKALPKQMTVGEMYRRYRRLELDMQKFRTHMGKLSTQSVPMSDVLTTVDEILQSDIKDEITEPDSEG